MSDSYIDNDVRASAVPPLSRISQDVKTSGDQDTTSPRKQTALPPSLRLGSFRDCVVSLDPEQQAFWCAMRQEGIPSFTLNLLRDLNQVHRLMHELVQDRAEGQASPVKFFVGCSDTPGIFNLGGDLSLFKRCIRDNDRNLLLSYAYGCVEAMYNNAFGFDLPIVSIGVVEGDALGGGFEAAISFNVLIAERGAKMGMPETLFNSFPGMGAYSFLSRKLDPRSAEKLIFSGKIYTAEEMHAMGIVDILAEPGGGREAARNYIAENARRHGVLYAFNRVRQKVNPLTFTELREITAIWVDTVLEMQSADVRKMEIVRAAQLRRLHRASATMV